MSQTTTQKPSESATRLADGLKELRRLEGVKATAEAEQRVNKAELDRLSAQAKAEFGTDDPDMLEAMAKEIDEKAKAAIDTFTGDLAAINADLAELGTAP